MDEFAATNLPLSVSAFLREGREDKEETISCSNVLETFKNVSHQLVFVTVHKK